MERLHEAMDGGKGTQEKTCTIHGTYTSFNIVRNVWSRCPTCQDEQREKERAEEENAKIAREQARISARLGRAAIPKRFIGRTFEGFAADGEGQSKALSVCRDYADFFESRHKAGQGLVLSGKPGTGKSHLAAAIMQQVISTHSTLYLTCMDLIRMVRETWRKDSPESEREVLERLGGIGLLVVDEVGVQYGTDSEQTILFDVLDLRYRDQMPTILITNQDMEGAKKFLGDRTWDRIRETARWVAFDWDSYRPQARKEQQ